MTIAAEGVKLHKGNFKAIGDSIAPLLSGGKAYRLIIKPWREKRSIPQNSLLWMWNDDVAKCASLHSTTNHTSEELHEFFKDMFCPAKEITIFGVKKWVKSTKLLDTEEMIFYLNRIEVWCAERGIKLRIPVNSEYHTKGHSHV